MVLIVHHHCFLWIISTFHSLELTLLSILLNCLLCHSLCFWVTFLHHNRLQRNKACCSRQCQGLFSLLEWFWTQSPSDSRDLGRKTLWSMPSSSSNSAQSFWCSWWGGYGFYHGLWRSLGLLFCPRTKLCAIWHGLWELSWQRRRCAHRKVPKNHDKSCHALTQKELLHALANNDWEANYCDELAAHDHRGLLVPIFKPSLIFNWSVSVPARPFTLFTVFSAKALE